MDGSGTTTDTTTATGERADLLETLAAHRYFLRHTVRGLTDDQARQRTTASELTLGGLLKHVTLNERGWIRTITEADPEAEFDMAGAEHAYELTDDETFEQWLEEFAQQAEATDAFIREVPGLDAMIPLPTAPWAPQREYQSVRRILLHMFRETAHHSGHADLIREELDGGNTTMQMARDAGMTWD